MLGRLAPDFFLPVRVLSRVFRGKFLAGLRAARADGRLHLTGRCPGGEAIEFERLVSAAVRTDWVVYAKPPFGGPEVVLKYLARYTHRVAISDGRLLDFEDGIVRFRSKDSAHGNHKRVMKLSASEFVRRFLLHVLPAGFVRIRHYGILSNRHRQEDLALCREWLGGGTAAAEPEETVKVPERRGLDHPDPGLSELRRGQDDRDRGVPADGVGGGGRHGGRGVCGGGQLVSGGWRGRLGAGRGRRGRRGGGSPCRGRKAPGERGSRAGGDGGARGRSGGGSGSGAMGWGLMGGREPPVGMRGAIERPKGECPPRSGSVQRDCIRQAGIGLGEGDRAHRPAGYNLLHFQSVPVSSPTWANSGKSGRAMREAE